jgi:hypothetical protein
LDISQVTAAPWSQQFKPATANPPSFGFTSAAVWMRCDVRSVGAAEETIRFGMRNARISEVTWCLRHGQR